MKKNTSKQGDLGVMWLSRTDPLFHHVGITKKDFFSIQFNGHLRPEGWLRINRIGSTKA